MVETISKSQVSVRYGINGHWVDELIRTGVLRVRPESTPRRPKIEIDSLASMREGEHYIVCRECGAYAGQIASLHLRKCSEMSLAEYVAKHPSAPTLCSAVASNKRKTEEQKAAQSEKLKARFQSEAGQITRAQISQAAKQLHANGYREIAAEFLGRLNRSPERREELRSTMLDRWAKGTIRQDLEAWREANPETVLRLVAHARSTLPGKTSRLHLEFKARFEDAGLRGFVTEHREAFYDLDEARPDLKLAVEVDGCYWHGCRDCGFVGDPGTRRTDASKDAYLVRRGWTVLRLWEHEIRASPEASLSRIRDVVAKLEGAER